MDEYVWVFFVSRTLSPNKTICLSKIALLYNFIAECTALLPYDRMWKNNWSPSDEQAIKLQNLALLSVFNVSEKKTAYIDVYTRNGPSLTHFTTAGLLTRKGDFPHLCSCCIIVDMNRDRPHMGAQKTCASRAGKALYTGIPKSTPMYMKPYFLPDHFSLCFRWSCFKTGSATFMHIQMYLVVHTSFTCVYVQVYMSSVLTCSVFSLHVISV